jgi:antitoxin VapB
MRKNPKVSPQKKASQAKPLVVDVGIEFARDLRAKGTPQLCKPVDKAFRDSLYEDD